MASIFPIALALFIWPAGAGAQAPRPEARDSTQLSLLRVGDRVRWRLDPAADWEFGDLYSASSDTLFVRTPHEPRVGIPLAALDALAMRSVDSGVLAESIGTMAAVGAALGVMVGLAGRSIANGDGGGDISRTEAIVFGALIGAVPGGFVGWVVGDGGAVRWIPVQLGL
jgi:hypothetical protein